jgi:hypothetical protein
MGKQLSSDFCTSRAVFVKSYTERPVAVVPSYKVARDYELEQERKLVPVLSD